MKKALLRSKTGTVYDIVLDEHKYYFRGDYVKGRLIIIPSKPHKITGIRLEFFGRIKTYINSKKQDGHYFFKELFPLDVQTNTLQEGKTYTFPFEFVLPVEVSLPSCTESDTNAGGMIEYVITATMERPSREWSALTASVHIPVLERLDVSKTELLEPAWDKVSWQSQHPEDIIDADEYQGVDQVDLSASTPNRGYTRGQKVPVTVDIHHFQPYQRTNGLTISLIRCTRVLCKEKAYLLSPAIVSSIKVDIDIQQSTTQTITQSILIPRYISPTINLNARLMQVDYRIEVRAELGESDRNNGNLASFMTMTADKRHMNADLALMNLELPLVIGTLPSPSSPPDILDPKFIKGVKHIGQENKSNQQQQQERQPSRFSSSLSVLTSLDLASIPAGLREITTANLRRQSNTGRQQQQQQQQLQQPSQIPSSNNGSSPPPKKSPLTISTKPTSSIPTASIMSSTPTTSIPTYRSGLAETTTTVSPPSSSIPVYRSDLPPAATTTSPLSQLQPPSPSSSASASASASPFYLTLSLGEPFDLLQSGFTDNDHYSLQSTRISVSSNSSQSSSKGMDKDRAILTNQPFASGAHHHSAGGGGSASSSSRSSMAQSSTHANNNGTSDPTPALAITTSPALATMLNQSSDCLSSDTSFSVPSLSPRSSLADTTNANNLTVTMQPIIDTDAIQSNDASASPSPSPSLHSSSANEHNDTTGHMSDTDRSPYDTPTENSIVSPSLLVGDTITAQSDTDDRTETTMLMTAHDVSSSTMTAVAAMNTNNGRDQQTGGDHGHDLERISTSRNDDTTPALKKDTIQRDSHNYCDYNDKDGDPDQAKESAHAGQLENSNNGLLVDAAAATAIATGIYRQVSAYSNYRQATNPGPIDNKEQGDELDSAYKPESTIEGLEVSAAVIEPAPMDIATTSNPQEDKAATTTIPKSSNGVPTHGNGILLCTESGQQQGGIDDGGSELFDKPHEMAYSDSEDDSDDDDDDDFLSILARREKQAESSYWQ